VRLASPFVLRSVQPADFRINGKNIRGLRRLGKQIILEFEDELFLIIHLMIAGRFQWKEKGPAFQASWVCRVRLSDRHAASD